MPEPYTSLVAVDIAAFGDRGRDDAARLHLRRGLYACLADAFAVTGLPWHGSHREDRGDGVFVVLPPEVPTELLLEPLAHHLHAMLRRHNRMTGPVTRLRVRMAVHAGRVIRDAEGVGGYASIHLFRLLEAPEFKAVFTRSGSDLGVVASAEVYEEVTRRGPFVDPGAYRRLHLNHKETSAAAWVWLSPSAT